MCKVFGIAGITNKNRSGVMKLLKNITPKMVGIEKHGLGYAAINEKGEVYGEKWLKVDHAWKKRETKEDILDDINSPIVDCFNGLVCPEELSAFAPVPVYQKFGKGLLGDAVAVVMHSRYATTGERTLENVHPFVRDGSAMVHNGMVYNHDSDKFYKLNSTCDSEVLLNQYTDYKVNDDSTNIESALHDVRAYLACLILTNALDEEGRSYPVLDIFKADAFLYVTYIKELEVFTYSTQDDVMEKVCRELGYTCSNSFTINDEVLIRIDAITGDIYETISFNFNSTSYTAGYTNDSEAYYRSKYGQEWEDYEAEDKEFSEEYTPKQSEPEHRKNVFDASKDPLYNGLDAKPSDVNDIIISEEEKKTVEKALHITKTKKHKNRGVV